MTRDFWKWIKSIANRRDEPEAVVLVSVFCVLLVSILFIKFASEVREGETLAFDEAALKFMRDRSNPADALGPSWFEQSVLSLSALGSIAVLTLVTCGAIGFFLIQRLFKPLIFLLLGLGGGLILNQTLKGHFDRPRPTIVPHLDSVSNASFPSGHALLSTIVYCTLAAISARFASDRRTKIYLISVALLFAFCVGCSRVYLGVHYPTDVMAGWTVGILWSVICWLATNRWMNSGRPRC